MPSQFKRLDNQAPVQSQLDNSDPKVGRSKFDFSHIHSGNALIGALTPVLNMEVVPNEDIDINLDVLITLRNPLTRPLLNGMRVYFHGYVNYLVDLWEGAKNFLDTGRQGDINLKRPRLVYSVPSLGSSNFTFTNLDTVIGVSACTPLSLLDYLGLPAEEFQKRLVGYKSSDVNFPPLRSFQAFMKFSNDSIPPSFVDLSKSPNFFPADCCVAYQRNWRDFYSNKNLLQNNKFWFPDNEDDFILSYSCEEAVALLHGDEMLTYDTTPPAPYTSNQRLAANILGLRLDTKTYNLDVTPEPNNPSTFADPKKSSYEYRLSNAPNLSGLKFRQFKGDRFTSSLPFPDLIRGEIPALADYTPSDSTEEGLSSVTMNAIRALETFTVFKERMARTSGDYNDMIEAQYGYNPHHHVREATYIGGFYTDFSFNSVVQQSQSTDDSPLGTKAGDGRANGSGRIGHIHTRDFGWLQVYMSIVPDVMYTQGIERQFSRKVQTDMYFPIFNNLAPQAILNKELYVTGNTDTDNDVFAYEDRFAEFKSRNNRVSGFIALPHDVAEFDASCIMARRFNSTPALNSQFVTLVPENIDMEVFSVFDEPPFDFQCGFHISRVFPGPYIAVPGSMSSKLHA